MRGWRFIGIMVRRQISLISYTDLDVDAARQALASSPVRLTIMHPGASTAPVGSKRRLT